MYIICLATDYDGTLAHDGEVDGPTVRALEEFRRTGRRLIVATGRELPDIERMFPRLDLSDRVVAENGALLFDPATKKETLLAPPPPSKFVAALKAKGKTPNHAFRADRNGCSSKKRLDPRRTRARAGVNGRQAGGVKGVRARDEAAVRRRPHKPDVNHQGEDSASLNRCSAVAARVGPGFGSARQHASRSRTCPVGRSWRKRRRRASTAGEAQYAD